MNKDWKEVRDQAAWTPERGPLEKDRCAEEQQAGQCGCSKETEAEGRQGTASERPRGPAVGDLAAHSGLCFSLSGEMVLNREVTRSDLSFQRIVQAAVLRKDSRRPGLKSVGVGVCARPSEVCPHPPPHPLLPRCRGSSQHQGEGSGAQGQLCLLAVPAFLVKTGPQNQHPPCGAW